MKENGNSNPSITGGDNEVADQQELPPAGSSTLHRTDSIRQSSWFLSPRSSSIALLLAVLGVAASTVFISFGIRSDQKNAKIQFEHHAEEAARQVESAFEDYELAALWIHQATSSSRSSDGQVTARKKFRELYEHLVSQGLDFQGAEYVPRVKRTERAAVEEESRTFYRENYPHIDYSGFMGFEANDEESIQPRSGQYLYYPIHYIEPVIGNEAAIDFDLYSAPSRGQTLISVLESWKPALTKRLQLVQETDPDAHSVLLIHPGIPLSTDTDDKPQGDLAMISIRISALLKRAARAFVLNDSSVYLYDSTYDDQPPVFLGGALVSTCDIDAHNVTRLPETAFADVSGRWVWTTTLSIATRQWTVAVTANYRGNARNLLFVILGGATILVACLFLAFWVYTNDRRVHRINQVKRAADNERAALLVESANKTAQAERELNDFIAHEVRNPLSVVISACNFVRSTVQRKDAFSDPQALESMREDVEIMDNSLQFINDLLRSMLDMHRAASNQLKIEAAPTDVLKDVLEPVDSMVYQRGQGLEVIVVCPDSLSVVADRLRLKQIILNLSRNAAKFVERGFIRLRAAVVDGNVQISVEDSGPGIPEDKRRLLFSKFQESLDSLNQGTGVGLCLCKNLADLMGARLWLDETYRSGIENCPGSRFVLDLNTPPLKLDAETLDKFDRATTDSTTTSDNDGGTSISDLPDKMSVLFVDDDMILRKLFVRGLRRVAPGWTVKEASNGETALRLVDSETFDLIFMDQHMASTEKQLLGTETVLALRSKGVLAKVCGLSANDVQKAFLEAGADSFMMKPFPTEKEALKAELIRVLHEEGGETV